MGVADGPDIAQGMGNFIKASIDIITITIQEDKLGREKFTKGIVTAGRRDHPEFNWVCCHTSHTIHWDGTRGVDWGHYHEEYDIKLGGTIGYEIYWARAGTFARHGDGGYLNWAYSGNVTAKSADGKILIFS
ncbi:hypothetical protein B0H34DRAFT_861806 [Crassisporium funariophilum]|nr:hypothetical protein B0H34DRAFT_861806 [Crassisporium funariophilum]